MAHAIPKREWLETEEMTLRAAYLRFLVERWLWQAPFAVLHGDMTETSGVQVPSAQALQDFGWIMEPESTVSH